MVVCTDRTSLLLLIAGSICNTQVRYGTACSNNLPQAQCFEIRAPSNATRSLRIHLTLFLALPRCLRYSQARSCCTYVVLYCTVQYVPFCAVPDTRPSTSTTPSRGRGSVGHADATRRPDDPFHAVGLYNMYEICTVHTVPRTYVISRIRCPHGY